MAPSKLRKAIGAVKDQTSISLAKVGGSASISDLEVAIVKATRHEEYPPEEKHIREILCLTLYSRAYVGACVVTISRRLSKTKNWVVALKSLMLIHRLLTNGEQSYEQEIFFATRRGTRLLNMSDFRDSRSNFWDYSAFVRTYSLYLDELLELRMQNRRGKQSKHSALASGNEEEEEDEGEEEEEEAANTICNSTAIVVACTPIAEMKNEYLYSRIQHYIQILDRFLACKPAGAARSSRLVLVALYQVVKESFQVYYSMAEILGILVDRFMKLDIPDSRKVHEIFQRIAKQWDELEMFYSWSKAAGISRESEYPEVENYPKEKLDIMEEIIREKMEMARGRVMRSREQSPEVEEPEPEEEAEEDMNAIEALPPPEDFLEEKEEMTVVEAPKEEEKKAQDIGDLLNLGEDAPTPEEHANQLALALFDGIPTFNPAKTTTTPWEAFNGSGDWETALVQTASQLSNQKAQLPGSFDELMLDGMYRQGALNQAVASSGVLTTGSASSVAFGSAGMPAMLALPAPPSADGAANTTASGADPFAASLSVAPPAYVQMSELEKKQTLLFEEQQMWQQYANDGMHGQVGLEKAQQNIQPHNYYGY